MTTPAHRPTTRLSRPKAQHPPRQGVAVIGYAFMGKAHSNAWRNVASFFDVPAFEQKVLVGRDADPGGRSRRQVRLGRVRH